MMYEVTLKEVHVSKWQIEADSEAEAIELVRDGEGDEIYTEYLETLDEESKAEKLEN